MQAQVGQLLLLTPPVFHGCHITHAIAQVSIVQMSVNAIGLESYSVLCSLTYLTVAKGKDRKATTATKKKGC